MERPFVNTPATFACNSQPPPNPLRHNHLIDTRTEARGARGKHLFARTFSDFQSPFTSISTS
jgi:hypothetical protein